MRWIIKVKTFHVIAVVMTIIDIIVKSVYKLKEIDYI